jgi:hypothetical protein
MNKANADQIASIAIGVLNTFSQFDTPKSIITRINVELEEQGVSPITSDDLALLVLSKSLPSGLSEAKSNSLKISLQVNWHRYVKMSSANWSSTVVDSDERCLEVLGKFGFSPGEAKRLNEVIPGPYIEVSGIYDGKRKNWYTGEVKKRASFYWDSYLNELQKRPWIKGDALIKLDDATSKIVGQLEDPTAPDFPSRGLVIGHVQSGKTQNFAGVIAKSIDAGYRLVIVLSGTTDILRKQTQRRLDMEIVGVTNILNGITEETHPEAYRQNDYVMAGNPNFPSKFIKHDESVLKAGLAPRVIRRTNSKQDFAGANLAHVGGGFAGNNFNYDAEKSNNTVDITHWDNLKNLNVRFIVVKKQKDNLKKLIAEIYHNRTIAEREVLAKIPALIIDDESDQASINTKRPTKKLSAEEEEERQERTAINDAIVELLGRLPRAQYVAYTATPFANVLVNPDDPDDLFPSQFIIPLDTPEGYMGASEFHDLEELTDEEQEDPAVSNKRAHIREFESDHDDELNYDALKLAIDDFVVSGALKLWRQAKFGTLAVDHHTMLIHISHLKDIAKEISNEINDEIWPDLAYQSAEGLSRLSSRYLEDIAPVSLASPPSSLGLDDAPAGSEHLPKSFEELLPYISSALDRIEAGGGVSKVVNSLENTVSFDTESTWKILVGGNMLSRGFTVEGLTVSFYMRTAKTQDTLMQMGRWFGYRIGFEDIVRVYLPKAVLWKKATATRPAQYVNLNDLFTRTAIVEENFREQVLLYGQTSAVDGISQITPRDIPPLIYQAAPELMPVARNKMYYAEVAFSGQGGKGYDLHHVAAKEELKNKENFELVKGLYQRSFDVVDLKLAGIRQGKTSIQKGRLVEASNEEILGILANFYFEESFRRDPHIALIKKAIAEQGLENWLVYLPTYEDRYYLEVDGLHLPVLNKKRSDQRGAFTRSNEFQRSVIEQISGRPNEVIKSYIQQENAQNPDLLKTASLLLTFTRDETYTDGVAMKAPISGSQDVATLFSYALPYKWSPEGQIGWRAQTTKEPLNSSDHPFKVEIGNQ